MLHIADNMFDWLPRLYDKVVTLAEKQGKQVTSVAMGSEEGFAIADKASLCMI